MARSISLPLKTALLDIIGNGLNEAGLPSSVRITVAAFLAQLLAPGTALNLRLTALEGAAGFNPDFLEGVISDLSDLVTLTNTDHGILTDLVGDFNTDHGVLSDLVGDFNTDHGVLTDLVGDFNTDHGVLGDLLADFNTDHGLLTGLVNTISLYNNRLIGVETRLSFRPLPLVLDGTKLLIPQFYVTRTGTPGVVVPPNSGASASAYWEVDISTGPTEARHYVDLGTLTTTPVKTVSGDAVPLISDNAKIIVATSVNGRVSAHGSGVKIVSPEHGGVGPNECTFAKDMDRAPKLGPYTQITDITAPALTGLGFTRGAYDPATLAPRVGDLLRNFKPGHRGFVRIFTQLDSDYGLGQVNVWFYNSVGGELASGAMTLERVPSARAVSYVWTGPVPDGAAYFLAGVSNAFGHDIRITGLQYATGFGLWWIRRDDFPAPVTTPLAAPRLIFGSTRFRQLREFSGAASWTRGESRIKAYTPSVPTYEIQLVYANFLVGAGTGEAEGANPITVSAVVEFEYTPGFYMPVTFAGRRSIILDPGAIVRPDPLSPAAPVDSSYWVRSNVSVASAGMTWPEGYYPLETGEGAYNSTAAGTQIYGTGPLVMPSGGAAATGGAYGPIAALAKSARSVPSVIFVGDSIADGLNDDGIGYIARGLQSVGGHALPQGRLTRGSDTLYANTMAFGWRKRLMFSAATHGIIALGANDIAMGYSVTNMQNCFAEIARDMRAQGISKVTGVTLSPRTSSSNGWATAAGQTAVAGYEGVSTSTRSLFNTWLKGGAGGLIDTLLDPNLVWEDPSAPGKWNTNGAAGYPTTDGPHPGPYFNIIAAPLMAALARTFTA